MKFKPVLIIFILALNACQQSQTKDTKPYPVPEDTVAIVNDTSQVLSTPPLPKEAYPDPDWMELTEANSGIRTDIRYASMNNFMDTIIYDCGRCFLRTTSAEKLKEVQKNLVEMGLGLKVYDCYRPRPMQWRLWERVPNPRYVADPRKGSMHNRGLAVDLTLVDSLGNELPMGTDFDFFGPEASPNYTNLPESVLANRALLATKMKELGFKSIKSEWWHFNLPLKAALESWTWNCP